jgi:hypothetical protein
VHGRRRRRTSVGVAPALGSAGVSEVGEAVGVLVGAGDAHAGVVRRIDHGRRGGLADEHVPGGRPDSARAGDDHQQRPGERGGWPSKAVTSTRWATATNGDAAATPSAKYPTRPGAFGSAGA